MRFNRQIEKQVKRRNTKSKNKKSRSRKAPAFFAFNALFAAFASFDNLFSRKYGKIWYTTERRIHMNRIQYIREIKRLLAKCPMRVLDLVYRILRSSVR